MWNGKCDDMRKILSASWIADRNSMNSCRSAYSDTLYDKNKIKTSWADERIKDEGYGMNNEWQVQARSKFQLRGQSSSPVEILPWLLARHSTAPTREYYAVIQCAQCWWATTCGCRDEESNPGPPGSETSALPLGHRPSPKSCVNLVLVTLIS